MKEAQELTNERNVLTFDFLPRFWQWFANQMLPHIPTDYLFRLSVTKTPDIIHQLLLGQHRPGIPVLRSPLRLVQGLVLGVHLTGLTDTWIAG